MGQPDVYTKMDKAPTDTSNLDLNDPVLMFLYFADLMDMGRGSSNYHTRDCNYIGNVEREKVIKEFLSPRGFTKITPVRKIRVTDKIVTSQPPVGIIEGTIDGTTLTVTGIISGYLVVGTPLTGQGITPGTTISALLPETSGWEVCGFFRRIPPSPPRLV